MSRPRQPRSTQLEPDPASPNPAEVQPESVETLETSTDGGSPPSGNGADHPESSTSKDEVHLPARWSNPEEKIAAAIKLARLPKGEWRAHFRQAANDLNMPPRDLEGMIKDIIKADQAAAKVKEQSKKKLFDDLRTLQPDQHRRRIEEWCEEHDENPDAILYEFRQASGMHEKPIWPTEVNGIELIGEIGAPIDRHVVAKYATKRTKNREVYTAEAARVMLPFWSLMTYMHGSLANYAPIPTPYGPKEATGKSTLMKVMSWMAARTDAALPDYVVNPTKGIWSQMHTALVLFVEEGQKVYKNEVVQTLFDASWQYGVRIPRNGKMIPVFCHNMMAMLAPSNIPKSSWSRHIPFLMMAKTDESVEEFMNLDSDEFSDIRRKSERWMQDHQIAVYARIKAKPEMPQGLGNRYAANWIVMFAIADEIGGEWPEKLRKSAQILQRDPAENDSWHVQLLRAMRRYVRYVNCDDPTQPVWASDFVGWLLAGCPIKKTGDNHDGDHWIEDKGCEWHAYRATERWQGQKITTKSVALEMKHFGWTSDHNRHGSGANRAHGYDPVFFAEHFLRSIGDPLKFPESKKPKKPQAKSSRKQRK
jgi:hypothetical protein